MLAISASPTTIAHILEFATKIRAGEMTISEVVDGFVAADDRDRLLGHREVVTARTANLLHEAFNVPLR